MSPRVRDGVVALAALPSGGHRGGAAPQVLDGPAARGGRREAHQLRADVQAVPRRHHREHAGLRVRHDTGLARHRAAAAAVQRDGRQPAPDGRRGVHHLQQRHVLAVGGAVRRLRRGHVRLRLARRPPGPQEGGAGRGRPLRRVVALHLVCRPHVRGLAARPARLALLHHAHGRHPLHVRRGRLQQLPRAGHRVPHAAVRLLRRLPVAAGHARVPAEPRRGAAGRALAHLAARRPRRPGGRRAGQAGGQHEGRPRRGLRGRLLHAERHGQSAAARGHQGVAARAFHRHDPLHRAAVQRHQRHPLLHGRNLRGVGQLARTRRRHHHRGLPATGGRLHRLGGGGPRGPQGPAGRVLRVHVRVPRHPGWLLLHEEGTGPGHHVHRLAARGLPVAVQRDLRGGRRPRALHPRLGALQLERPEPRHLHEHLALLHPRLHRHEVLPRCVRRHRGARLHVALLGLLVRRGAVRVVRRRGDERQAAGGDSARAGGPEARAQDGALCRERAHLQPRAGGHLLPAGHRGPRPRGDERGLRVGLGGADVES
ncbi:hypothetical protein FOCC_FOCC004178, partial [Frankliniella occidentalis]